MAKIAEPFDFETTRGFLKPEMKVVAVVHAKKESKRLPNKNLRLLGGVPLIAHAIMNAQDSIADAVYVDSEDKDILTVGISLGTKVIERPPYLANNKITGDDLAYWQAQNFPEATVIVQVVPTSPFTKPETINKCIDNVLLGANSSFTVSTEQLYTWSEHVEGGDFLPDYFDRHGKIINSNELPFTYVEHTGVYAFRRDFAFKQHRRIDWFNNKTVEISSIEKIDINYERDFEFAEIVWAGLHKDEHSCT
jgi:N-acylneuraminate cytidylyltransferase